MALTKTVGRRWREAILDEGARVDKADREARRAPVDFAAMNAGRTLCVRCRECNHRAAIADDKLPAMATVSRKTLDQLKLRCTACGSRDVARVVSGSLDEAKRFLSGDEIMDFAK